MLWRLQGAPKREAGPGELALLETSGLLSSEILPPKVGGERARSKRREFFFTQQLRERLDESYFLTGSGCLWSEEREKDAVPGLCSS